MKTSNLHPTPPKTSDWRSLESRHKSHRRKWPCGHGTTKPEGSWSPTLPVHTHYLKLLAEDKCQHQNPSEYEQKTAFMGISETHLPPMPRFLPRKLPALSGGLLLGYFLVRGDTTAVGPLKFAWLEITLPKTNSCFWCLYQVIQAVTFLSPSWRPLHHWQGHLYNHPKKGTLNHLVGDMWLIHIPMTDPCDW